MSGVVPALPSLSPELMNIILEGPAQAAPPGEVNDFNTTDTLHPSIIATIVLTMFFSTLVVVARLYTKVVILRTPGWDDFFVFISWVVFVAYSGLIVKVYPEGGIHIWDRTVAEVVFVLRYVNYIEILYSPMILFVKISILLQYNRIFVPTFRSTPLTWLAIWLTIGCNIIFYVTIFFFCIFQCSPREAIWNVFVEGQCYDITKLLITVAAFNLASDIIILIVPQHAIWKLQMTRRRKMGLSAVFGIGALACIVTALRVQSTVRLIDTLDVTWYLAPSALWTLAEVCLAYIASCLPTMPKFFQTLGGTFSRFSKYGSRSNGYTSNTTSEFKDKPVYAEPNRFERGYRREDRIEPAPPRSREGETWFRDDDADTIDTDASTQNDWILPPTPPEEEPHRLSVPLRSPTSIPRAAPSRSLDVTRPAHPILGRIPTRSMDLPRPALQPQEAQARAAGLAPPIWRQRSRPLAVEVPPEDPEVSDRSTVLSQSLPSSRPGERETVRAARSQPGSRPSEPPSPIETRPRDRRPPQPPPKDPPRETLSRHNTVPSSQIRRTVDVDVESQPMPRSRRASGPRHIAQLYKSERVED